MYIILQIKYQALLVGRYSKTTAQRKIAQDCCSEPASQCLLLRDFFPKTVRSKFDAQSLLPNYSFETAAQNIGSTRKRTRNRLLSLTNPFNLRCCPGTTSVRMAIGSQHRGMFDISLSFLARSTNFMGSLPPSYYRLHFLMLSNIIFDSLGVQYFVPS